MPSPLHRLVNLGAAVVVTAGVVFLSGQSRHVNLATVCLMSVLVVLVVAAKSGFAEAIVASLTAALLLDYFFLPPPGFGISQPDHWVALAALLATAIIGSRLSDNARKWAREADAGRDEMEKLYALSRAIQIDGDLRGALRQLPDQIVQSFGLEGAALYVQNGEETYYAGQRSPLILEEKLRQAARGAQALLDPKARLAIMPLRLTEKTMGSVALLGSLPGTPLLFALAHLLEATIKRAQAAEQAGRAEESERRAELKSTVLDALAHDLKTPVASIRAAVTCLLSSAMHPDPPSLELLQVIKEEISRLNVRVYEAINVARLDARRLEVDKLPEDIRRVIDTALEELGPAVADRTVQLQVPGDLPLAHLDFRLIKQVLKQLLDNALKYSPADSPVTVSAGLLDGTIVIHVADCGPGISEQEQERIFENFYRGRRSGRGAPGVGMGLAIAKGIMDAHGDRIWLTSRPGAGSVFHLCVAVYRDGAP